MREQQRKISGVYFTTRIDVGARCGAKSSPRREDERQVRSIDIAIRIHISDQRRNGSDSNSVDRRNSGRAKKACKSRV